jgi:hypothetical protein
MLTSKLNYGIRTSLQDYGKDNSLRGQIQFRLHDNGKDIRLLGQGMLTSKLNYGIGTSLVDLVYLWYAF